MKLSALVAAMLVGYSKALVIESPCCTVASHIPAHFGRNISDGIPELTHSEIVPAIPFDACGDYLENNLTGKMVLVIRGKCNFAWKAVQAQNANATAIVVMDDKPKLPDEIWGVHMISDGNASEIQIPSVFISFQTGQDILDALNLSEVPTLITLNTTGQGVATFRQHSIFEGIVLYVLTTSVMFVVLSAICLLLGKIVSWHQRTARTRSAKRLPVRKYQVKVDEDICSICLEVFEQDTMVKVLPCDHEFHQECINPWLENRSGSCPLCKREALDENGCSSAIANSIASWMPHVVSDVSTNTSIQMFSYGLIMMLPIIVAILLGVLTVDF